MTATPIYMKRYMRRLFVCMGMYVLILFAGLSYFNSAANPSIALQVSLAIATALPIVGVFWAIFKLLGDCDDEYQRLLLVKQVLLATSATLAVVTLWEFMQVYEVLETGPRWFGAIWFAMLGLAAPIIRWRA